MGGVLVSFIVLYGVCLVFGLCVVFDVLLAIMNPFSALPIFPSLTEHLGVDEKSFITSMVLVLLFTIPGNYVLAVSNILIPSLRVGGGILLLFIALDMPGSMPRTKRIEAQDIAVVPLATPMVIGPGTITALLLLTSRSIGLVNTVPVLVAGYTKVYVIDNS